jgi:DNA-binding response OmpR family regulator
MRILIVEDDPSTVLGLSTAFTEHRYNFDIATDGVSGYNFAQGVEYDLIVLDLMLPKLDGISLCQRLRDRNNSTPILMLTAMSTTENTVSGLDVGADDYVVKPFKLKEVLARVRALLRRSKSGSSPILRWQDLQLDPLTMQVEYAAQPLRLSPKEYALLELLMRSEHRVLSRDAIIQNIWSYEVPEESTVKSHVKRLRQKLKAVGTPEDCIETVYGLGYRLKQI